MPLLGFTLVLVFKKTKNVNLGIIPDKAQTQPIGLRSISAERLHEATNTLCWL
jgi:hypothetical protein